ncbi:MAG: helix-turn-helix transcriptional regulator [Spirochaetales bacterium]|nr:helix-turn-helix transcriptional regulator [Spirochaetales bacterium]
MIVTVMETVVFNDLKSKIYPDSCIPLKEAAELGDIDLIAIGRGNYPGEKLRENDLKGIRSIGFWNARKEQKFGLPTHQNEGIEFTLCEAGHVSFNCEGKQKELGSSMMAITRPWQPHQLGDPHIEICSLHWLILDVGVRRPHQGWNWPEWIILNEEDLSFLTRILRENEAPVWQAKPETAAIFKKITSEIRNYGNPGSSSSIKLLINELLLNIFLTLQAQKPRLDTELISNERNVRLFLKELEKLLSYQWTSESMADYCHLKSTRFIHYCKKLTNMSPIQYLQFLRIQEAKKQLQSTDSSITDIAFDCGFSSSQYFNRIFRKYTDMSPRDYRNADSVSP